MLTGRKEMTYRRIKTITSHTGYSRFLAECEDLPADKAFIPTPRDIKSPFAHSPSTIISLHEGKHVFVKETSHKRYEVYELGMANYDNLMSDDEATARYIEAGRLGESLHTGLPASSIDRTHFVR